MVAHLSQSTLSINWQVNSYFTYEGGGSTPSWMVSTRGFLPLHFLQFDWLRAVVFQLNLKYLHVKITKLLQVVVQTNNSMICTWYLAEMPLVIFQNCLKFHSPKLCITISKYHWWYLRHISLKIMLLPIQNACLLIGHFRVPKTLTFKIRPSAKPLLWKWVLFAWE